jgi:hypothetical protein
VAFIPSDKAKAVDAALERWEQPNVDNAQAGVNLVQPPSTKQLRVFSSQVARTCAGCKHFNHKHGQDLLFKQKGLATIVHDYQWKQQHLGADPKFLGHCEQRGALTASYYVSCEDYKAK